MQLIAPSDKRQTNLYGDISPAIPFNDFKNDSEKLSCLFNNCYIIPICRILSSKRFSPSKTTRLIDEITVHCTIITVFFPSCEIIVTKLNQTPISVSPTVWLTKFSATLFINIDPCIYKKLGFLVVAFQIRLSPMIDWLIICTHKIQGVRNSSIILLSLSPCILFCKKVVFVF